jgi:hypothetical protein
MYIDINTNIIAIIVVVIMSALLLVEPNKHALIITDIVVQVQPSVHQRLAAVRAVENVARVPRLTIKTLHLEWRRRRLDRSGLLEREHKGLVFVFADELHGGPVRLIGRAQTVEAAGDNYGVDFRPVGENTRDRSGFFGGKL